jgi:hypothetical protein
MSSEFIGPAGDTQPALDPRAAASLIFGAPEETPAEQPAAEAPKQPPKEQYFGPKRDDKGRFQVAPPPTEVTDNAPDEELAQEADAAPSEVEAPGETETDDPAEELPTIDPPRSWTKEEKEAFQALPREHQQNIADRERARDADLRRRQDEVAAVRREAEAQAHARIQAAEQARRHYEAALPQLQQAIVQYIRNDFADIKTYEDIRNLAKNDPMRHGEYQAAVQHHQAIVKANQDAQEKATREAWDGFNQFRNEETQRFLEKAPEFSDPVKAPKYQAQARDYLLKEIGVPEAKLAAMYNGQASFSIHDHQFQLIVRDALKYREAKTAVTNKKPAPKPSSPPAQKPGVSVSQGEVRSAQVDVLNKNLDKTGSREAAFHLLRATRSR